VLLGKHRVSANASAVARVDQTSCIIVIVGTGLTTMFPAILSSSIAAI
jgi:hypothetical protein